MKLTEAIEAATKSLRLKRDCEKYRRYAEEKSKIPKDIPAKEYEEQIRLLCKRFKI